MNSEHLTTVKLRPCFVLDRIRIALGILLFGEVAFEVQITAVDRIESDGVAQARAWC